MSIISPMQIALVLAGMVGAALKAAATNSQVTLSKKSVIDVVLGGLTALLVPQFFPSLLPPGANVASTFAIVAIVSYASADFVQNIIAKTGVTFSGSKLPIWLLVGCAAMLTMTGCSSVSANLAQDVKATVAPVTTGGTGNPLGKVIVQGLQDATFNLDSAVTVGALDVADPAPTCFHSILKQLGIDNSQPATPAASFTPRVSDLISAGSVLYIRAQQAKKLQGQGITVAPSCKELAMQFLLDAAAAGVHGLPGGGALPVLR